MVVVLPCVVLSCLVFSWFVLWVSCHDLPRLVLSLLVLPGVVWCCLVLSCLVLSGYYLVAVLWLSCGERFFVLSGLDLACFVLSLSCLVLSFLCRVWSCLDSKSEMDDALR